MKCEANISTYNEELNINYDNIIKEVRNYY